MQRVTQYLSFLETELKEFFQTLSVCMSNLEYRHCINLHLVLAVSPLENF
jgi:hypothetical protein